MTTTINYKSVAVNQIAGTWTHAEGAVNETLTVPGYVYGGTVVDADSDGQDAAQKFTISRSTTSGISTITIRCQKAVADGRFIFWTTSK